MKRQIGRVLIANRGEIAVRIIRSCRELGIESVAIYSEVDEDSLHVRLADKSVALQGVSAKESYLDVEKILNAADQSGADAVHPGYGFLSENSLFPHRVEERGLAWIGPPSSAIEIMGNKVSSRIAASAAGVSCIPGDESIVTSSKDVIRFGEEFGWPVAIKASHGGGGRGIRVVNASDEAESALDSAKSEAERAFGNADCYLERFVPHARHIEMQVMGDDYGNIVWLGERDCSVQRRNQKLLEETPAPGFSHETRVRMGEAAVRLAQSCGYVNAGTVEFLYAGGEFWFLEMNTRLQVEHAITECVTGFDLVAEQIRIASGERLSFGQGDISPRGHSIECRINAEKVASGRFLPSPGRIDTMEIPGGPFVRFDTGFLGGDDISPYYDNLIGKVIVWARNREEATARMIRALIELDITGVSTTIPGHLQILTEPAFVDGSYSTKWVEESVKF